jgi:iron complex outermembrane recepter protein
MLSAAVYELEEQNRKVTDPANPLNEIQTGMTRNRGLELEAVGQVLSWLDIAAHYNYIDVDEQLEIIPEHQFAVWSTSRFQIANTPGYFAGFGMRYMSSFRDGSAPVTPQVTLVDASLGFDDGSWRYALNVQNLTDETYFSTCLARGDCFYGARRTVSGSATYRF